MRKRFKKIFELVIEKIFFLSGSITSITILLIVVFLFKEGLGLFSSPVIEQGYELIVNKENSVTTFTPDELKNIFDRKITSWKDFNGTDAPIEVFYVDDIVEHFSEEELGENFEHVPFLVNKFISENPNILAFIPQEYVWTENSEKIIDLGTISIEEFVAGKYWSPSTKPAPLYGLLPLLTGTLWVSFWAIVFALPFGLAVAIYLAELASPAMRAVLKPIVELLAGIPSVVYGFFGLIVIVPLIRTVFDLPVGETALAGAIILAIMALPTIITVAQDAISAVPRSMREASLALGASQLQTISRVVLPHSVSGIMAAVVLGIGRAIGETMAVLMVTGNSAIIPSTLLEPVRTIPATIAAELGESPAGGAHYQALFMLGCILFIITLIISIVAEYFASKRTTI